MTFNQQVAKFVSDNLDRTADRYGYSAKNDHFTKTGSGQT